MVFFDVSLSVCRWYDGFFDGSLPSLQAIVNLLSYFSTISGLTINKSKTSLFLPGSSMVDKLHLSAHFGFTLGTLPVRYLGLSLLPRKMTKSDYAPLIERVKKRLHSWTSRHLSFAGRTQLISSVIQSIMAYWCAAFVLPKRCIHKINIMCRRFLWSGDPATSKKANVKWSQVCSPKSVGGLGLRDLFSWNKVFGLKLIWLLFSNSGFLWVAWCKEHKLRRKFFWNLSEKSSGSSTWSQLLKLRPIANDFIYCKIGDGSDCYLWLDNWTPFGQLLSFIGDMVQEYMGFLLTQKFLSWPQMTGGILEVRGVSMLNSFSTTWQRYMSPMRLKDIFKWKDGAGPDKDSFKFSLVRSQTAENFPEVSWHKEVWFSGNVPKHDFILWLVCLDRLSTKSKLAAWGVIDCSTCLLCEIYVETRDHMFLRCPYSYDVWRKSFERLNVPFMGFGNWQVFLRWLKRSFTNPA